MTDPQPGRERILQRIRAALAGVAAPALPVEPSLCAAGIFAPIPDVLVRFQAECEANRTELYLVDDATAPFRLCDVLSDAWAGASVETSGARRIYFQDAPVLRHLAAQLPLPWPERLAWSSGGPVQDFDCAAVTLAEACVARTGSVLISTAGGGRAASVLPPAHVVYAAASQLVAEIDQALALARERVAGASLLSLITGPSRTSDIEKKLVFGAHGPRRLVVLLRVD